MKIRRGPPVERIINDPAPKPLISTNTPCRKVDDAACTIQAILRPKNALRQTKHGTMVRPEDLGRNAAEDLIDSFPMVLFRSKDGSDGKRCSQILKKARQEVKLKKELIVEVELNETKIAKEMMSDLERCTGETGLPQVFICQKFIGGLKELKIVEIQGLVEMQLRMYARKIGEPHPAVSFSKDKDKKKKNKFQFRFVRLSQEDARRAADKHSQQK